MAECECTRHPVLRWIGFTVSLVSMLTSALATAFNVYAMSIKATFSYTQSQVELISSVGSIGIGLSFVQPILASKYGYKVAYIAAFIFAPASCFMIVMTTFHPIFFSRWDILVGIFLLFANLGTNILQLTILQITVSNFDKRHSGNLIGLYTGLGGLGKIFFAGLHQFLFPENLGVFFLSVGVVWIVSISGCFFFHRPDIDKTSIGNKEYPPLVQNETKTVKLPSYFLSPVFHLLFWPSVLFGSAFFAFLNNLTYICYSAGINEAPMNSVYLICVTMVISRVGSGRIYDCFASDRCGFILSFACYACYGGAMVIGVVWFNRYSAFLMTALVGLSCAGSNTLPFTILSSRFGRHHFSTFAGAFYFCLTISLMIFQLVIGKLYDKDSTENNNYLGNCQSVDCFYWTFVMFGILIILVILSQVVYTIYLKTFHI